MAADSVGSIFTREHDCIAVPESGAVAVLPPLRDFQPHTAVRNNNLTEAVPHRRSAKMTQVRVRKQAGEYKLLIDGMEVPVDANKITRITSFHAGPETTVRHKTDTSENVYKFMPGLHDSKADRRCVGPLLISAAVEAEETLPEAVRVEFYQRTRVDGVDLPPRFLRDVPLEPHSVEGITAPSLLVPFPVLHTHAPYVEVVDASNVRKHQASQASGWWSWLVIIGIQTYMGAGPIYWIASVSTSWWKIPSILKGITPANTRPDVFKGIVKMVSSFLSFFLGVIDLSSVINAMKPKEFASLFTKGIYWESKMKDYDAAALNLLRIDSKNWKQADPIPIEERALLAENGIANVSSAIANLGNGSSSPQPRRVRFTIRKLVHSLRQIRRIRGPEVDESIKELKYGRDLQTAGFAEEKVLMEWMIEGDGNFHTYTLVRMLASAFRKAKDWFGIKPQDPARDENNNARIGYFANNGPMMTAGLEAEILRRNCAWIQVKVVVEDISSGYDRPIQWSIEVDEEVGQKAGWIESGYSGDVEDLVKEIVDFRHNVCEKKIEEYEWFQVLHHLPRLASDIMTGTGSERQATSDNLSQFLTNMRQTTRERLCHNAHRIGAQDGVGLHRDGKLDTLMRRMETNTPRTRDEAAEDFKELKESKTQRLKGAGVFLHEPQKYCTRLLPQRAVVTSTVGVSPEQFAGLDMEVVDFSDIPGVSRRFPDIRGALEEISRVSRYSSRLNALFDEWEREGRELLYEVFPIPSGTEFRRFELQLDRRIPIVAERMTFSPACQIPPYEVLDRIQIGKDSSTYAQRSLHALSAGTSPTDQRSVAQVVALAAFSESLIDRIVMRSRTGAKTQFMYSDGAQRRTRQFIAPVVQLLKQGVTLQRHGHNAVLVGNRDPLFACYPCSTDAYRVLAAMQTWNRTNEVDLNTLEYAKPDGSSLRAKHALWPQTAQLQLDAVVSEYIKLSTISAEDVSKLPFYALQNALATARLENQTAQMLQHSFKVQDSNRRLEWSAVRVKVAESYAAWDRTMVLAHFLRCDPLSRSMASLDVVAMRPIMIALRQSASGFKNFRFAVDQVGNLVSRADRLLHHKVVHQLTPTAPPLPEPGEEQENVASAMMLRNARLRVDINDRDIDLDYTLPAPNRRIDLALAERMRLRTVQARSTVEARFWVSFGHGDQSLPSMTAFGPQSIETVPIFVNDISMAASALHNAHRSTPSTWSKDETDVFIDDVSTPSGGRTSTLLRHSYAVRMLVSKRSTGNDRLVIGIHAARVGRVAQTDLSKTVQERLRHVLNRVASAATVEEDNDSSSSSSSEVPPLDEVDDATSSEEDNDSSSSSSSEVPLLQEAPTQIGAGEIATGVLFPVALAGAASAVAGGATAPPVSGANPAQVLQANKLTEEQRLLYGDETSKWSSWFNVFGSKPVNDEGLSYQIETSEEKPSLLTQDTATDMYVLEASNASAALKNNGTLPKAFDPALPQAAVRVAEVLTNPSYVDSSIPLAQTTANDGIDKAEATLMETVGGIFLDIAGRIDFAPRGDSHDHPANNFGLGHMLGVIRPTILDTLRGENQLFTPSSNKDKDTIDTFGNSVSPDTCIRLAGMGSAGVAGCVVSATGVSGGKNEVWEPADTTRSDKNNKGKPNEVESILSNWNMLYKTKHNAIQRYIPLSDENVLKYAAVLTLEIAGMYIFTSMILQLVNYFARTASGLYERSRTHQHNRIASYGKAQRDADKISNQKDLRKLKRRQDLLRRASQADIWARLLYHNAQLSVPITLPAATQQLYLYNSNGSLSHQSSVCLWNTERVFQSLLLAHGQTGLRAETSVSISAPRAVRPATVIPTEEAIARMRKRIGYQLRKYVYRHYATADPRKNEAFVGVSEFEINGMIANPSDDVGNTSHAYEYAEDTLGNIVLDASNSNSGDNRAFELLGHDESTTGTQYGQSYRKRGDLTCESWLQWSFASEADLLDYADNCDEWENEIRGNKDMKDARAKLLAQRASFVKAAAYSYRNPRSATILHDKPTSRTQDANAREAELLNRETRAQFVYSVIMACALFYRITGILLTNVRIVDNDDYTDVNYLLADPEEQVIKNDTPPSTKDTQKAEMQSYLNATEALNTVKEQVKNFFSGKDKEAREKFKNDRDYDWDANVKNYNSIFDEDLEEEEKGAGSEAEDSFISQETSSFSWMLDWRSNMRLNTDDDSVATGRQLEPRPPLAEFMERARVATGDRHSQVVAERPHVAALALSEACLVFSSGTGSPELPQLVAERYDPLRHTVS